MKTHTTPSGKIIGIPSTPDEFELYSRPEAEIAATEICQAIAAIADEIDPFVAQGYVPTPNKLRALCRDHIGPMLKKHAEVGAMDSEPYDHCLTAVETIVATLLGGSGNRPRATS